MESQTTHLWWTNVKPIRHTCYSVVGPTSFCPAVQRHEHVQWSNSATVESTLSHWTTLCWTNHTSNVGPETLCLRYA